MERNTFVHLHVHSEYSLLDGAARVSDIVTKAKELGMPAIALTDHGVMYGAIEFYNKAKSEGIKPIIGCEMYIASESRHIKEMRKGANRTHHLIVLAKDLTGYKNLVKLVSKAHLEGFYYKPRIDKELLQQYKDGLVILSSCLAGEIPNNLLHNEYEKAKEAAKWYKEQFGDDFYLELQNHRIPEQKIANDGILKIAKELDIKLVATNDTHYVNKGEGIVQKLMICIGRGKKLDELRDKHSSVDNDEDASSGIDHPEHSYIKSLDEMREAMSAYPEEALYHTLEIADKCDLQLPKGDTFLPEFAIPDDTTMDEYVRKIATEGLYHKYKTVTPELLLRLNYELDTIVKMGFSAYFLVVWDFIKYAKDHNIPVGPGRGSAAGSLVAYCLSITELEPTEYNLLFERFLNPERVSMPDIDVDFCIEGRQDVIDYVTKKYGEDKVCQIITFGTMAGKAAIRDAARVMNKPLQLADKLAKMVTVFRGKVRKLDECLTEIAEFKELCEENPDAMEIVQMAIKLEGLARNSGVHAAGVVISRIPLLDIVPLQNTKEEGVVTQYEMGHLEKLGLLKMDFLGLRNLTVMQKTLNHINKKITDPDDKWEMDRLNKLDLKDPAVYDLIATGYTLGMFQLESDGMVKIIKNLKPTTFEDIIALLALYRPGPLDSGMVDDFIDSKHGRKVIKPPFAELEPVMRDTYGTLVYQEQIMQVAQVLAGYSLGEADMLRRAMGKKSSSEMIKQRETFITRAVEKGFDIDKLNPLFDQILNFAEYCFNKSHSAAYALITYQTAYLKKYFPAEYMSALISSMSNDIDKRGLYINEAKRMGIKILPPDVNYSDTEFTPTPDGIRFGLGQIKNLGDNAIRKIIEERVKGPFKSLEDMAMRLGNKDCNKKSLEALILSGACDTLNSNRQQGYKAIEQLINIASSSSNGPSLNQASMFGDTDSFVSITYEKCPDYTGLEKANNEKEYLGWYISNHPLEKYIFNLSLLTPISSIAEGVPDGTEITVGGLISNIKILFTKKDARKMCSGKVEDTTGSVDFILFPRDYEKAEALLVIGAKLKLSGKLRKDDKQIQLDVKEVSTLEEDKAENHYKLHVQIPADKMDKMSSFKGVLQRFGGSTPVYLHTPDGQTIMLPQNMWVNGDSYEATQQLKLLFGNDNIVIERVV